VCALLAALKPKVQSCKEDFKAQELGNALYGLQVQKLGLGLALGLGSECYKDYWNFL
jgi:hypothetical protein